MLGATEDHWARVRLITSYPVIESLKVFVPFFVKMNIKKNHALIASAGTGKTEQLAIRFISLLDYSSPDTSLAVTFTKNAAGEILERIIKLLVNAYFDDNERKKLEDELKISLPLEKEKLKQWISAIIDKLPRLSISTLDSFFYQIVACYPLELGLNSAPDIAQGYVDKKLKKKVIKQLFARARNTPEFLTSLKEIMIGLTGSKETKNYGYPFGYTYR